MEPHFTFNSLDYVIFGIILLSGLLALLRGFVREVLSLASWVGAYFVAAKYYPLVEPWLRPHIKNHDYVSKAAAVSLFIAALIAFSILGYIIAQIIRGRALTSIDRSLGFIFGLARGALVVCIVYMAAVAVLWPKSEQTPGAETSNNLHSQSEADAETRDRAPEWLTEARTYHALKQGAGILRTFLPSKELEQTTKEFLEEKNSVQRKVDDKELELLSTPSTSQPKNETGSGYDEKTRTDLNEKVKP